MPDCCVDVAITGLLGFAWQRAKTAREHKRRVRLKIVGKICQQTLGQDFPQTCSAVSARVDQLPVGVDSYAVAALQEIQQYQDNRQPAREIAIPKFNIWFVVVGGCSSEPDVPEVEVAVCEDLKRWLLSAANGGVCAEEVSKRLAFCRHILVRPEIFDDDRFLAAIGVVCERLDELRARLAGAVRGCASHLGRVLACGREFVEGVLPVLLLSVVEPPDLDAMPHLSMEALARSSGNCGSDDICHAMWKTDVGCMVRELVTSTYVGEVWGCTAITESDRRNGLKRGLLDEWLRIRHQWLDDLESRTGGLGEASGLEVSFRSRKNRDLQQTYLDLYRHVDSVVLFLSMLMHYRSIANIAGDSGMYHLRERLHHLLQEFEHGCVHVFLGVSNVMGEVRRSVIDLIEREPNPVGHRRSWLERLKYVDEAILLRSYKGCLGSVQRVRFLSSEARLPALQASCRANLERIAAITCSSEFRSRCADVPPESVSLPILALSPACELPSCPLQLQDVGTGLAPEEVAWSVERSIRIKALDLEPGIINDFANVGLFRSASTRDLGDVANRLNFGAISSDRDVFVVYCERSEEYVALFKAQSESIALECFGLSTRVGSATASLNTVVDVSVPPESAIEGPSWSNEPGSVQSAAPVAEVDVGAGTILAALVEEETLPNGEWTEEQRIKFYEVLFNAVLVPFFGGVQDDMISVRGLELLLVRSGLSEQALVHILRVGLQTSQLASSEFVDFDTVRSVCRLVAHSQELGVESESDLRVVSADEPRRLPVFRGLAWDGRRLRVLEPLA